MLNTFTHFF